MMPRVIVVPSEFLSFSMPSNDFKYLHWVYQLPAECCSYVWEYFTAICINDYLRASCNHDYNAAGYFYNYNTTSHIHDSNCPSNNQIHSC
jgi:hypothetical protein